MNYGYKDLPEADGPTDCPQRILDLLTPTDNERVNAWRAECRARLARRAAIRVRAGDTIRFAEPLRFRSGAEIALFRFQKGSVFHGVNSQGREFGRFKIPNWRDRTFEVVRNPMPTLPAPGAQQPRLEV